MKVKAPVQKKIRRVSKTNMPALQEPEEMIPDDYQSMPAPAVDSSLPEGEAIARGGVATPFPWKLHEMLEDAAKEGNESIVSWQSHGYSFLVHKPKLFVEKIMPTYFNQSKFASFQRQLNLYGFQRLTSGRDKGAYYHSCFVRHQVSLCRGMVRQKIKGTKVRRTSTAEGEPDFYTMTNVNTSAPSSAIPSAEDAPREAKTAKRRSSEIKKTMVQSPKPLESTETTPTPQKKEQVEAAFRPGPLPPVAQSRTPVLPSMPLLAVPTPSSPRNNLIAAKERAHKLREERLNAVRDALKQTEMFCDEDEAELKQRSSMPTISIKPMVPSVSPLDSEVSDWEDDGSSTAFTPLRLQQQRHSAPPMPPLPVNPPLVPARLEPMSIKLEPLAPRFTATQDMLKSEAQPGDVLFFEGKPFRYLEHLDSLPPPPQPVPAPTAPVQVQKPKQWAPPNGFPGSVGSFTRDSLQSLMRVDPQAIFNFHMRPMPWAGP